MTKSAKSKLYIAIALILCFLFKPKKDESSLKTTTSQKKPVQDQKPFVSPNKSKPLITKELHIRKFDTKLNPKPTNSQHTFTPKGKPTFITSPFSYPKMDPIKPNPKFNPKYTGKLTGLKTS